MGAVAYYGYGASAISQANKPAFSVKPAPALSGQTELSPRRLVVKAKAVEGLFYTSSFLVAAYRQINGKPKY
jgi:hypothetical protein